MWNSCGLPKHPITQPILKGQGSSSLFFILPPTIETQLRVFCILIGSGYENCIVYSWHRAKHYLHKRYNGGRFGSCYCISFSFLTPTRRPMWSLRCVERYQTRLPHRVFVVGLCQLPSRMVYEMLLSIFFMFYYNSQTKIVANGLYITYMAWCRHISWHEAIPTRASKINVSPSRN